MTRKTRSTASMVSNDTSDSDNWTRIDYFTTNNISPADQSSNQVDEEESDENFVDRNTIHKSSESDSDDQSLEKIYEDIQKGLTDTSKNTKSKTNSLADFSMTPSSTLERKSSSFAKISKENYEKNQLNSTLKSNNTNQSKSSNQSNRDQSNNSHQFQSTIKSGCKDQENNTNQFNQSNGENHLENIDTSINQKKNMSLDLKFKQRDKIIEHLNELSGLLLHGEKVSVEARLELIKQTNDLVHVLMNLPLVSMRKNKILASNRQSKDIPVTRLNQIINKLVLELDRENRMKLIQHLIDNRDFIISNENLTEIEIEQLLNENNSLIEMMLKLSTSVVENDDVHETNAFEEKKVTKDDFNLLSEQNRAHFMVMRSRIDNTNLKIREVKSSVDQNDLKRSSAKFRFEVKNFDKFLKKGKRKDSSMFFCRSLQWCLSVQLSKESDPKRYLGIYLRSENNSIKNWTCDTNFELKLIAQIPNKPNRVLKTRHKFSNKTSQGYGFDRFLPIDELVSNFGGFLLNDCIKVEVNLLAEEPLREIF